MSKKTVKEIEQFGIAANEVMAGKGVLPASEKTIYAIKKVAKHAEAVYVKYQESADEKRLEHSLEDRETGAILRDEKGNYKFSKAGLKALTADINKLREIKHEIESHIVVDAEGQFTDAQKEALAGFILPEVELHSLKKVK